MTKTAKRNCSIIGLAAIAAIIVCVGQFAPKSGSQWANLRTVLQLGTIYALVAVSMNLCNGFTGLFSLGQAGFMTLGAYTYAILTIPVASRAGVYYLYGVAGWLSNIVLPIPVALLAAGLMAALLAALIGAPVLKLKSDYLAIATLGFAEVVRIVIASSPLNRITNGSLGLTKIPGFSSYYGIFIVSVICIAVVVLLINSSYGRAFKAIRDDEVAAEAMGINLAHHKQMSFIISSFFAGIGGALMAMYMGAVSSTTFTIAVTYFILLIVVIGGMGSVTGSIISSLLVIAAREWWLRPLDQTQYIGTHQVPLLKAGFRMVVFSVILMIVVLFFRKGIMGDKEFNWDDVAKFFRAIGRFFKRLFTGQLFKKKSSTPEAGGDAK
jgi:branched-chain amino acid transport system permease protein